MDPMDQFFRDKLSERRYEYQDAYWQEAEQLIEQRRRRRRAFWWWTLSVALLLAGMAWWLMGEGTVSRPEIGAFRIGEAPGRGGHADGTTLRVLPGDAPGRERASKEAAGHSAGRVVSRDGRPPGMNPATPGAAASDGGRVREALPGKPSVNARSAASITEAEGRRKKEKEVAVPASPLEQDTSEMGKTPPVALSAGREVEAGRLPVLLGPVMGSPAPLQQSAEVEEAPIRPGKRLGWELAVSAMAHPDGDKILLGANAGIRASYKVRDHFRLALGAQYRLRGGTFGPSADSRLVAYGFGREEEQYRLQPNRLHYAEALLQGEWHARRHQFALGIGWSYLLGIEGSLSRSVKEEFALTFGPVERRSRGWLDEKGYKKQFWLGRAAYFYRLGGRWSLGAELRYIPGGILENDAVGEPGTPLLRESGPAFIDLGIKYAL